MKKIGASLLLIMILFSLAGCGKDKSQNYDGYYVGYECWLEISDNKVTAQYVRAGVSYMPDYGYTGYIEEKDGIAYVYFTDGWDLLGEDPGRHNPLKLTSADGGKIVTLSSDDSSWSTDTFNKVTKEEYDKSFEKQ